MSETFTPLPDDLGVDDSLIVRVLIEDRSGIFNAIKQACKGVTKCRFTVPRFVEVRSEQSVAPTKKLVCDITASPESSHKGTALVEALKSVPGVEVIHRSNPTYLAHLGGKIDIVPRLPITNEHDLARVYTPGVASVCLHLKDHPEDAWRLTMKKNTILIASDGSRILALGNIGQAGQPVMEGKACLFKLWGDVNAVPLVLGTQDTEEFIRTVKNIAGLFGGINLEDIASPRCWEIERRLQEELDIPVFHDDQHGTAIVVLAATLNACKVVRKRLANMRIVLSGVGAAGMACARLLIAAGAKHIVGFKKEGAIFPGRGDMNSEEQWLAENTKPWFKVGPESTLAGSLKGADMFLGLSGAKLLKPEDLKDMRRDAIVFPLANPIPEVDPDGARQYARIIGTGSSEYENQINNALVFPGFFRGALDARVRDITVDLKLAAARALAAVIPPANLRDFNIIPDAFDTRAHAAVAEAVRRAAHDAGTARRVRKIG